MKKYARATNPCLCPMHIRIMHANEAASCKARRAVGVIKCSFSLDTHAGCLNSFDTPTYIVLLPPRKAMRLYTLGQTHLNLMETQGLVATGRLTIIVGC